MKFHLWAVALASALCVQANEWHAYYRLTGSAYQEKFDEMVSQGYRLNSVSGYERNSEANYAVIFEKRSTPAWKSHHGMTSDKYHQRFEDYRKEGYRVVQVNGYTVDGKDRYTAIWEKDSSIPWATRHGMSREWMQKYFDQYLKDGYRMTQVSGYEVGGETRFAAVWEQRNDTVPWVSVGELNSTAYQAAFDERVKEGYRLVDVDGYQAGGEVLYAAIWDKSPSGAWVARHGLDSPTFQAEFDKYRGQGYVLRTFNAYNDGKADRYAAIWVK
ncbi:hypothetical protein BDV25DRAFT_162058 [Aspergillus avenaceus]|uniref:Uncharacterized protein n=1 Tax=Aspergillus avenaceus TaxID=36643 RepID=A0A5N6TJX4_ASPAV|nr:hypothetical protein BDV25DRAFT_162058 [Aspergillus avenaceus]